jgi:surface protein
MFHDCKSLQSLDLIHFNTTRVKDMQEMFNGSNNLRTIYVGKGWTTDSVTNSTDMFAGCTSLVGEQGTKYDESHVDAARAHIDEGLSNPGYLSRKREAYAALVAGQFLTFYYDDERSLRSSVTYLLNTGTTNPGWSEYAGDIISVVFDSTFVAARPTSTYGWFSGMDKLITFTGMEQLNTSSVTDMRRMFAGCKSLSFINMTGFNTENVTNMWAMFHDCDSLKWLNLSSFNTSNVTNMARMFSDCDSLATITLGSLRTDSVKDMAGMFAGCKSLTNLDLRNFNTDSVKYMGYMFSGCKSLTSIDLSGFNTRNVTEMEYMFQGCDTLASLDLTGFNTRNVTDMGCMFNGCKNLETIHAGNGWNTGAVTESGGMFAGCTKLVGGQGTVYDENFVDATRAHIDGGPSNPGYLTGDVDSQLQGDVNADGEVNIADVNCITGVILGDPDIYEGRADVNGDGEVTIADINAIIDLIL